MINVLILTGDYVGQVANIELDEYLSESKGLPKLTWCSDEQLKSILQSPDMWWYAPDYFCSKSVVEVWDYMIKNNFEEPAPVFTHTKYSLRSKIDALFNKRLYSKDRRMRDMMEILKSGSHDNQ